MRDVAMHPELDRIGPVPELHPLRCNNDAQQCAHTRQRSLFLFRQRRRTKSPTICRKNVSDAEKI